VPAATRFPESIEPRVPSVSWPDEELVFECLQGNEGAWAALVEKYRNLVYSVPVKYRMPPEDAADVFQAVWTDLFAELPRLRNAGALRSWLATEARHAGARHWRGSHSSRTRPRHSVFRRENRQMTDPGIEPHVNLSTYACRSAVLDPLERFPQTSCHPFRVGVMRENIA